MGPWLIETIKSPQIIAILLTTAFAVIGRLFQPATRLIWGTSHGFTFGVPQQTPPAIVPIETGTVIIHNLGSKAAEGVEIVLNFKPQHFQIWPALNYQTVTTPENHFVIKIDNLGPREHTTLELLSANAALPATLRVRSRLGDAKLVPIAPRRVIPAWRVRIATTLLLLGLIPIFYVLILFIKFVAGA